MFERSLIVSLLASFLLSFVDGCSNIIVSSGASEDSSTIVAYNADSATLYGSLYHYPAAKHAPGTMRDVYDWDSGRYLGQIPEAFETYNVVGNMNEYGVVIGETTYGGNASLQAQSGAKIDYGSLIWITLQRSKSAREAIETIDRLMNTYGYASEGESFSIADQKETWVMEIIGKGEYELGAVWVARKIPDGYVCAHANQARITTFPQNDPEICLFAKDVVSFAKKIGLYSPHGSAEEFSFSDVYDPVTFSGARFCEGRVWSFYSTIMGEEWAEQYLDYAQGYNLTNRMPLFVQPANGKKISVADTMQYMRSHYEHSALDMTGLSLEDGDVGAESSENPFRAHPLTWSSSAAVSAEGEKEGETREYFHERPIATQQTGWNFVAQSRRWMPRELSGLLWFGVDDAATTVRFPMYSSATKVPELFAGRGSQDGETPPMMQFSMDSAFYVFNLVANWAYGRWNVIYPEVLEKILKIEQDFMNQVEEVDAKAQLIAQDQSMEAAVAFVTDFSVQTGNELVRGWSSFFGQLFVKYRDGYRIVSNANQKSCGCSTASEPYPQAWYDRIVRDTGDHYLVPEGAEYEGVLKERAHDARLKPVSKIDLLSRR